VVWFRVLSRRNLANRPAHSSSNPRPFNGLPPLEISCLSFFDRRSLFSIACSLFLQNTRGGGTSQKPPRGISNLQTLFSRPSYNSVTGSRRRPEKHAVAGPLFSWCYELPFSQLLYFDNHPQCPGVWGTPSRFSRQCQVRVTRRTGI
jgi:hypothetical protein